MPALPPELIPGAVAAAVALAASVVAVGLVVVAGLRRGRHQRAARDRGRAALANADRAWLAGQRQRGALAAQRIAAAERAGRARRAAAVAARTAGGTPRRPRRRGWPAVPRWRRPGRHRRS